MAMQWRRDAAITKISLNKIAAAQQRIATESCDAAVTLALER
jgi:hypothetical protein